MDQALFIHILASGRLNIYTCEHLCNKHTIYKQSYLIEVCRGNSEKTQTLIFIALKKDFHLHVSI